MNYDGVKICGVPDNLGDADCRWPMADVSVFASGTLGSLNVAEAVEQAIAGWNKVCGLRLTMTPNRQTAHIVVDKGSIDGPNGTLAWSELPCGFTPGRMRQLKQMYDTGELWVIAENPPGGKIDAVRVICHELGHAIGIQHIESGNLMAPTYSAQIRWPRNGDITQARARYGLPAPAPTPAPIPPSVPPSAPGVAPFGERFVITSGGREFRYVLEA